MTAIVYLLLRTLKNRILNLRKKPAYLVLIACVLLIFIVAFVSTNHLDTNAGGSRQFADIRILYGIIAGLGLIFVFSYMSTGLSTGSTLFSMADVGLLFVSPISSKKILIYGLVKQMATTLLSAIFILYQVGTIKQSFGLGIEMIINLFLIYAILIFFCQLLSIAIYIFSNGRQKRKQLVKFILYGFIALIALGIYLQYVQNGGNILDSVLNLMTYKPFQFLPVIGWAVMFISACIEGSMFYLILSLLLFIISSIVIISLFTSGDADYYEDVLTSTEVMYNKLQDAKNGKTIVSSRKVKVKNEKTGLNKGWGYKAIFYKHLLELKRSSRFTYFDTYTLFTAVGAGAICFFVGNEFSVYIVLGILVYIQFFMTILGKLSQELMKPYIYLIPEKSIKKVIAASMTTLLKPCFDAVVIFTVVCIVTKTSPLLNLFLALAYASTGAIFVSYALLCQRIFGSLPNKIIQATLGIVLFLAVLTPGIAASVAAIVMLPAHLTFLGTLPFTFCCIVITIFVFAGCGNLLDKAEYTSSVNN